MNYSICKSHQKASLSLGNINQVFHFGCENISTSRLQNIRFPSSATLWTLNGLSVDNFSSFAILMGSKKSPKSRYFNLQQVYMTSLHVILQNCLKFDTRADDYNSCLWNNYFSFLRKLAGNCSETFQSE